MPPGTDLSKVENAPSCALVVDLRAMQPDQSALPCVGATAALLPPVTTEMTTALLDLCMAKGIAFVLLSGARHGADIQHLDVLLQVAEARAGVAMGTTRIIAMAGDNPHGLLAAASFAGRSSRLIALGWDAGALATAMASENGLGAEVASSARATLLLAAAAANVMAIDGIEPDTDAETFRSACIHANAQGFYGKMTGTQSQVPVIQSVFAD